MTLVRTLFDYLNEATTTQDSQFQASFSTRGGYITFSNSGRNNDKKFFTLGLDSFISTYQDILDNITDFSSQTRYDETSWRLLGNRFFSDESAKAMMGVQTKPFFSILSKLIYWANKSDITITTWDTTQLINLEEKYIQRTIEKLDEIANKFNLGIENNTGEYKEVLNSEKVNEIIFKSFKYLINQYGEEKGFSRQQISIPIVDNQSYEKLTLSNFFGKHEIIRIYDSKPLDDELKTSGVRRFFSEEFTYLGSEYTYFSNQWNGTKSDNHSLNKFKAFLKEKSNNELDIIFEKGRYILIQVNGNHRQTYRPQNIIYYGSPGTGKSYKINNILKDTSPIFFERVTFHPEYDNSSFVGGYKPISDNNDVKYRFVPQVFTNIYTKAWKDRASQYYLVIEEINRGNCAEIFGDIFQLLDRNSHYTVSPSTELHSYLIEQLGSTHEGIENGLKLPSNLSILATMNTSDQSLFPMDSAFKRRWDWEYIPICYEANTDEGTINSSFSYTVKIDENSIFKWIDFIKAVNQKIKENENLGMDKCIGNYFITPNSNEITLKEFINKAIFYLWNDVFKDEDESNSIFSKGMFYEDFFPVQTNGIIQVKNLIESLSIKISTTETHEDSN